MAGLRKIRDPCSWQLKAVSSTGRSSSFQHPHQVGLLDISAHLKPILESVCLHIQQLLSRLRSRCVLSTHSWFCYSSLTSLEIMFLLSFIQSSLILKLQLSIITGCSCLAYIISTALILVTFLIFTFAL